jgi:hypothetical protein
VHGERLASDRKSANRRSRKHSLGSPVVTLISQHENHMKTIEADPSEIPARREAWTDAVRQERVLERKGDERAHVALVGFSKFQRIGYSIINIVEIIR